MDYLQPAQVNVSIFPNTLPTMRVHHYSLDTAVRSGSPFGSDAGIYGKPVAEHLLPREPERRPRGSAAFALNPQIGGGDYWGVHGHGNYNAMLAELKHQFSQQFMADAQFTWAKSMDTSSGPYFEQDYPYNPNLRLRTL